ncbi:FAD-dependent monooxygenase [Embleya sp. AB8]|uniref:FAD-dependent monooxygenase n=1 Tax=Embleya sp. AB8 TaxID=3156304 RepID=UPI003C73D1DA
MSRTVVIAGGGPTGLLLGCELALAGAEPVVVEPRTDDPEFSPGMAVHGRTLEILEQRGLADRIQEHEMFAWPRTPFAFHWLDLGSVGPTEYTYAYPQWRLERLLRARAAELGVQLRRGSTVVDYTQDADGVEVRVRAGDGAEETVRAAYLVGADGADSTVRRLAGIDFVASGKEYAGVLGDVELEEGEHDNFDGGLYPAGVFGALPLQPGRLRLMTIEFGARPPGPDVPVTTDELLDSVRRVLGKAPRVARTHYLARYGGPTRLAERYRDGRVFLAGDAAHVLFISGTQGVNTGLHDALNLGWKLAAALDGHARPGLLDTYESERRPVGERVALHSRAQMALMHPLAEITPLRDMVAELTAIESVNRHLLEMTTAVGYPPPADAEPELDPHPLVGRRVPAVVLTTGAGETNLLEFLRTGRGLLLDLGSGPDAGNDTAAEALAWADRVDLVTAGSADPDPAATRILVRPDGFVAWADDAAGARAKGLTAALTTWFGDPDPAAEPDPAPAPAPEPAPAAG